MVIDVERLWDKVRVDPVLKFFVVAITGYGIATFEGPMLSLKM
jgi:cytochrome c oxidase cbb3-type subunit I/II